MKNLLHNISIMTVLTLMMVGIQSCSDDWQKVGDVQVSFTAILPTDTRTRSFGKAEQVNTLVNIQKGRCRCTYQQWWQLELSRNRPQRVPDKRYFGKCTTYIGTGADIQFYLLDV